MLRLLPLLPIVIVTAACAETRGSDWVRAGVPPLEPMAGPEPPRSSPAPVPPRDMSSRTIGDRAPRDSDPNASQHEASRPPAAPPRGRPLGVFRNTYYSFPSESDYQGPRVEIFDASCQAIATVPQAFHDTLCVQGSGRLASQRTVSFAKRDCSCARVCPRTGQRICFESLEPSRFPWGRGAANRPIHPMRTVAVDTAVIPLGTPLYIPAFVGLRRPDGSAHDGCFLAEDRGLHVSGQQIDLFAGSESMLRDWNQRVPTASGVAVYADPACAPR